MLKEHEGKTDDAATQAYETGLNELQTSFHAIAEKLYKAQQKPGDQSETDATANNTDKSKDEPIDAEVSE